MFMFDDLPLERPRHFFSSQRHHGGYPTRSFNLPRPYHDCGWVDQEPIAPRVSHSPDAGSDGRFNFQPSHSEQRRHYENTARAHGSCIAPERKRRHGKRSGRHAGYRATGGFKPEDPSVRTDDTRQCDGSPGATDESTSAGKPGRNPHYATHSNATARPGLAASRKLQGDGDRKSSCDVSDNKDRSFLAREEDTNAAAAMISRFVRSMAAKRSARHIIGALRELRRVKGDISAAGKCYNICRSQETCAGRRKARLAYEEALTKAMLATDAVESFGSDIIRAHRRELVKQAQGLLEQLEHEPSHLDASVAMDTSESDI